MTTRALTMFRIGGWSWLVTGAGHLALAATWTLGPEDPATARAVVAMRDAAFVMVGVRRSLRDLNLGMALVLGVAMLLVGALCVLVARSAPELVTRSRALSGIALLGSLVAFGLSLWLLPVPPIITFAVAGLGFGGALGTARPS